MGLRNRVLKMTSALTQANTFHPPGFASRLAAAKLLDAVLRRNRPLDEQLDDRHPNPSLRELDERDRALARRIVATVLRRLGTLRRLIGDLLDRGLPNGSPQVESALLIGVPHPVGVAPRGGLAGGRPGQAGWGGLATAGRGGCAGGGPQPRAPLEPLHLDPPAWFSTRWTTA